VDGKIDGAALDGVTGDGEYEATGAKLNGEAWICGRTTMQQHFAEDEPFVSGSNTPAGPRPAFVARRAKSNAISLDTLGKLRITKVVVGVHVLLTRSLFACDILRKLLPRVWSEKWTSVPLLF
jgi:hypothetical protein